MHTVRDDIYIYYISEKKFNTYKVHSVIYLLFQGEIRVFDVKVSTGH